MTPELPLQEYLVLSVMAFRGTAYRYPEDELVRDVQIAAQWLQEATNNERRAGVASEVLSGNLFIGVVDGQVVFRSGH